MILSHNPAIARRQLSTLAKQGRVVTSKSLKPGAKIKHAPAPITAIERRSNPNRPGGPRITLDSKPKTFAQSMLLLGKMMQS